MVKVLENRVVDLDIMPGTKEAQEAAAQAKKLTTEEIPNEDPKELSAGQNAGNAGMAVGGALGGAVKGLVDTTGNTVGALGEGLYGTVSGVGKGLGAAAVYGGSAVGIGGKGGKQTGEVKDQIEAANQLEAEGTLNESQRRKSDHEENVKALENFEERKPIQMDLSDNEGKI